MSYSPCIALLPFISHHCVYWIQIDQLINFRFSWLYSTIHITHSVQSLLTSHYTPSIALHLCLFLCLYLPLFLVFCCYQQVYDIFNMPYLGVILQVRGRDGMSTLQTGVAAYSQSHISHISHCFPCGFHLAVLSVLLLWQVIPNCTVSQKKLCTFLFVRISSNFHQF